MIIELFFRYFFSKRAGALIRRMSFILWIAVSLSVAALFLVLSVMKALHGRIEERLLSSEPTMTFLPLHAMSKEEMRFHPLMLRLRERNDLQVELVQKKDLILKTVDGHFSGVQALGSERSRFDLLVKKKLLSVFDANLERGEVIMGSDLTQLLGLFEADRFDVYPAQALLLPVGSAPPFQSLNLRKSITAQVSDFDAQTMLYDFEKTPLFQGASSADWRMEVWSDEKNLELPITPADLQDFRVQTWQEKNQSLLFALSLEKWIMTVFLSLAALVASFSIFSSMSVFVSKKKAGVWNAPDSGAHPKANLAHAVGFFYFTEWLRSADRRDRGKCLSHLSSIFSAEDSTGYLLRLRDPGQV